MRKKRRDRRQAGFTLAETLVMIGVIAILVTAFLPEVQRTILRARTKGAARETVTLFQIARYEATKQGLPAVVLARIDPGTLETRLGAFLDENGNGGHDAGEPILHSFFLPSSVRIDGPPGDPAGIKGFTPPPLAGDPHQAVFRPDGSVADAGAFRYTDRQDNFLEVEINPPATARVRVRKWDELSSKWLESGEGGRGWNWN